MNEKKFYVYEHWRPDTSVIFYVGKGYGRRARDLHNGRNRWHSFIIKKLRAAGLDVDVRIVSDKLTEADAFAKERELIAHWRLSGASLVNMTDGGEGASGVPVSQATRDLISKRNKGRKPTDETRERMSKSSIGNKRAFGYKRKPHEIAAMSARSRGKIPSPETREKMRAAKLGRKLSDEHKAKIRASIAIAYQSDEVRKKCFPSPETIERGRIANLGKKQTKQHIEKKIAAALGKTRGPYKLKADRQVMLLSAIGE